MDKSRQQFEEWLLTQQRLNTVNMKFTFDGKEYFKDVSVNRLWLAWQASRETLINSLEPDAVIYRHSNKTNFSFEKSKFNELIQQGFIPLYRLDK